MIGPTPPKARVSDAHPARLATLTVFAGLPGTGKSTLARELARITGAMWLRIDSIEQAIRESGLVREPLDDLGYRAAYAVAEDNLRIGRDVVADCVNDCALTRNAWRDTGTRAGALIVEIEVVCSDAGEHRRRVESRPNEVPGLKLPTWQEVIARAYEPWDRQPIKIDTADQGVAACVVEIRALIDTQRRP